MLEMILFILLIIAILLYVFSIIAYVGFRKEHLCMDCRKRKGIEIFKPKEEKKK